MRKLKFTIILLIATLLCSCNADVSIDGINSFQTNQSHYELNVCLLPSDDFLSRFKCIDIDYSYREQYNSPLSLFATERSMIIGTYEMSVYEQAKAYCLEKMELSSSNVISYNGYTFLENIELAVDQGRYGDDRVNVFPQWFNMFAYNDDLKCLVFMGFYSPDLTSRDAIKVVDNWGEFLKEHYSDVYDFGIK